MLSEAWLQITSFWEGFKYTILTPSWTNYFYWLIGISLVVFSCEIIVPWRKNQSVIRKDFWLDIFYMFFNFFFFYMIGFAALSYVSETLFLDGLRTLGLENLAIVPVSTWPSWLQLMTLFLVVDFVHWNIHRLLHRVPWLWEFHKIHHSVEEMGFAAHLRYHWMENVVYKSLQYIPIALIGGFQMEQVFIVHMLQTSIGHLNHSNLPLSYGPFKYIFNNPKMHIWHHAEVLPKGTYGVNFGISLSIWDYLFGTAYIPKSGRDIKLGFEQMDKIPKGFAGQFLHPLFKRKK